MVRRLRRRLVASLVVALVASLCSLVGGIQPAGAKAPSPLAPSLFNVGVTSAGPAGDGYWSVTDGGLVVPMREAPDDPLPAWYGDMSGSSLNAPIVGIAGHPNGGGYWFVGRDGGVFAYGSATYFGGSPANNIVGITATPDGGGYWLVGADGGIFAYGNAPFKGSLGGQGYTDVVGMAAMPSGLGYWLVHANGTVSTFGDAVGHGGAAASNIVGMARTFDGGGYWLLGADGAIYADNAPNYGRGAVLCCGFTYSAIVAKRGVHHGYRLIGLNTNDFPSLEDNQSPTGTADENSYTQVAGWGVDPNETTKSINVQIKVDGIERYNQPTAGSRPDVNVALHGISGNHGFIWNIATGAPDLLNAQPHTVQVYAIDSGLPAPQLPPLLLNQTTWTAPNLDPVGVVERAGSQITGWVNDPNDPNQRLTVKIYLDGATTPNQTLTANVSRPNNNPPANDGFQWTVPAQYLDGKNHPVKVEALDYPSNTPVRITDTTMSFLELDDTWTAADSSTWNSNAWNASLNDANRVVDVSGNQGRLWVAGSLKDAQAKQVVTSTNTAIDSEALLSYQFVDPGDITKLKVALRGSTSVPGTWMSDGYQAEIRSYSNVVKIYRVAGGTRTDLGGGFTYTPGTAWQSMRMRVTGTNPAIIRVKMWAKGTQEPDPWTTIVTDTDPTRVTTAGVFHVSLTNGGTTARTARIDDLGYTRLKTAINEGNPSSAPSNSVSIYLHGGSSTNFTALGQQEGNRVKSPTCSPQPCTAAPYDPLVVLAFGAQTNDLTQTQEPANGPYIPRQLAIDGSIAFINGYYGANPGHELVLGIGVNNSNTTKCGSENANKDCARKKGADWAGVVNSVWNAVKTTHPNVTVVGAQDFEAGPDFGGPAPQGPNNAKAWVAGFESAANGRLYINFGSAEGCRTATYPYGANQPCQGDYTGSQAWTLDDYWFLSRGVPSSGGALPEIYNLSGNGKSDDWRNVSWYGYDSHDYRNVLAPDSRIDFLGVLTEAVACQQRGCGTGADAPPGAAWANFRQELDKQEPCNGQVCTVEYPTKGESLGFTSDIKWEF